MTTAKTLLESHYNIPSEPLNETESNALNNELTKAIQSKEASGVLSLTEPRPSTIYLSYFGLKNTDDLRVFLLSPAGESIIDDIASQIALEKAAEQEQLNIMYSALMMEEHKRFLLFNWLLKEEEESLRAEEELLQLQQEKELYEEEKRALEEELRNSEALEDILDNYYAYTEKLLYESNRLEEEGELLNNKHVAYEAALSALEQSMEQHEEGLESDLQQDIDRLQKALDSLTAKPTSTNDEKKSDHLTYLTHRHRLLDFQKTSLTDLLAVRKGEKRFVDTNGNQVQSYKNADFVLKKDQQLLNEDNKHYLLEKDQKWETMNNSEKEHAHNNFERTKKEIKMVRHLIKDEKNQEIESHQARIAANKIERSMLQKRLSLTLKTAQVKRLQIRQPLTLTAPSSSLTLHDLLTRQSISTSEKKVVNPVLTEKPSPQIFSAAFVKTYLQNDKEPTWGSLFRIFREIPNPDTRKKSEKDLTDAFEKKIDESQNKELNQEQKNRFDLLNPEKFKLMIQKMLRTAPVPNNTMDDLLTNMSRYDAEAYNPSITQEKSPSEMISEQPEENDNASRISNNPRTLS